MSRDFLLPQLGEGLLDAELVRWLVDVGDHVDLNQNIAEVETAKAVIELPSPFEGTVQTLHHSAGDTIEVGERLISFDGADAAEAVPVAAAPAARPATAEAAEEKATPNLVGYGVAPRSGKRPQRRARTAHAHPERAAAEAALWAAAPHDVIAVQPVEHAPERPRSTPPVRKLAHDLGVDIALVPPTGHAGLVTREDVQRYAAGLHPAAAAPATAAVRVARVDDGARITRIPIRGVRKHTAEAMVRSAFTAPHVTEFHTVDVTDTMRLITALKTDRALQGHRIGVLAIAAKAVCLALGATPSMNASWDDAAGEIVEHHYVNLGIAAATDRGLVVPNIPDAERMTLVELADAITVLAQTARAGHTTPAEMMGGTFSITNIGVFGVEAGTPIINPGEAGILGLGAVQRRPWEHDGQVALRDVLTLSVSFDHRLVDGAEGSRFLMDVAGVLEQPGRAMLLR